MFAFADQEKEFNRALRNERKEGEAIGEARGEVKGEVRGENKLAALMDKLFSLNRLDDAKRAATDEAFRAHLFSELKLP